MLAYIGGILEAIVDVFFDYARFSDILSSQKYYFYLCFASHCADGVIHSHLNAVL